MWHFGHIHHFYGNFDNCADDQFVIVCTVCVLTAKHSPVAGGTRTLQGKVLFWVICVTEAHPSVSWLQMPSNLSKPQCICASLPSKGGIRWKRRWSSGDAFMLLRGIFTLLHRVVCIITRSSLPLRHCSVLSLLKAQFPSITKTKGGCLSNYGSVFFTISIHKPHCLSVWGASFMWCCYRFSQSHVTHSLIQQHTPKRGMWQEKRWLYRCNWYIVVCRFAETTPPPPTHSSVCVHPSKDSQESRCGCCRWETAVNCEVNQISSMVIVSLISE